MALSPGGNRPFTFADVIHALQQDVENANQSSDIDTAFTLLTTANEALHVTEGTVTTTLSATTPQWGSGTMKWGQFVWQ
jgi:hypothetical protein